MVGNPSVADIHDFSQSSVFMSFFLVTVDRFSFGRKTHVALLAHVVQKALSASEISSVVM